jgi:RNA polymerase sigma-70 factor, ECF subfamily
VAAFMFSDRHCAIICENLFFSIVNNRVGLTFMFVDDDQKEKNVSPIAANTVYGIDPVSPAVPLKAVSGNTESEELAVLFRNHYKDIFGAAYRITGSASDAEDVLQTVFLRMTSSGARRDLSPNPGGYLRRAAANASLDLLRSRSRANSISLDVVGFSENLKDSKASPEDDLAQIELRELLRHAVAKLGGRSAAAFALRYFEGRDNAHIAEILGTSQLVVAVTLHRARTRLRKEIGSYLEKHHEEK